MTRPETCGAAGGAISFWMRLLSCEFVGSIVTTIDKYGFSGTDIFCYGRYVGYIAFQSN